MKREKGFIYPDINLLRPLVSEDISSYDITELLAGKYKVDPKVIGACENYFSEKSIEKKHFDSLIYIGECFRKRYLGQFSNSLSYNGRNVDNSKEEAKKYIVGLEDIYTLYEIRHLIELFKNNQENINLISLTWKYTENNVSKNFKITTPNVIAGLVNVTPEKFANRTPLSLKRSLKQLSNKINGTGVTYFRKLMAESLKLYLDDYSICSKKGVLASSNQLRLIHFIMNQFEIIDLDTFSDEVNSIRSLLKTPFKS